MSDNEQASVHLQDPLTDVTRKNRRNVLIISIVSIAIAYTGLIPKKIPAFSIEFDITRQGAFLWTLFSINIYLLFAFVVSSLPDFCAWTIKCLKQELKTNSDATMDEHYKEEPSSEADYLIRDDTDKFNTKIDNVLKHSRTIYLVRGIFDFILPVFICLFSIYVLFIKAYNWK